MGFEMKGVNVAVVGDDVLPVSTTTTAEVVMVHLVGVFNREAPLKVLVHECIPMLETTHRQVLRITLHESFQVH